MFKRLDLVADERTDFVTMSSSSSSFRLRDTLRDLLEALDLLDFAEDERVDISAAICSSSCSSISLLTRGDSNRFDLGADRLDMTISVFSSISSSESDIGERCDSICLSSFSSSSYWPSTEFSSSSSTSSSCCCSTANSSSYFTSMGTGEGGCVSSSTILSSSSPVLTTCFTSFPSSTICCDAPALFISTLTGEGCRLCSRLGSRLGCRLDCLEGRAGGASALFSSTIYSDIAFKSRASLDLRADFTLISACSAAPMSILVRKLPSLSWLDRTAFIVGAGALTSGFSVFLSIIFISLLILLLLLLLMELDLTWSPSATFPTSTNFLRISLPRASS